MQVIIRLSPNAKHNRIESLETLQNGSIYIKIKVCAPPQRGKANKAMINLLSKSLCLKKSSIKILAGQSSPLKKVNIDEEYANALKKIKDILKNTG
ncbi:DUF167 family protein [Candidatus Liberibacter sp.]|uniref:DUF167 family protein n=1 Tax=Candidatus Liberibacter sp. TaxID=34022 RepID=UPI0015F72E79|nr:DUF167 family protein [Candidatus Liberibacter sp.]MBA5724235.1 DUF167 domain-containing protein [Candidatus Liberibacter sp.]